MKEAFLEIKDLKKSFGEGEAKQEVLRGIRDNKQINQYLFISQSDNADSVA